MAKLFGGSRQPKIFPARSDHEGERQESEDRLAPTSRRSATAGPGFGTEIPEQLSCDAVDGERRALQSERYRARRGLQSGHGSDDLGAGASARRGASRRRQHPRRRLLAGWRERTDLRPARRGADGSEPADGPAVSRFRQRRGGESWFSTRDQDGLLLD